MLLMEEAERIAKEEHGSSKISVISGEYVCVNIAIKLCHIIKLNHIVTT